MSVTDRPAPPAPTKDRRGASGLARTLRAALRTARGRIGGALTLLVLLIAFLGPAVAPKSYSEFTGAPFAPPGTGAGLLGADTLGRDVLSRVLDGGWQLLILAFIATALAVSIGAALGVGAAYRGKWQGSTVMRVVDIVLSVPQLVFVLLIVSVLGASNTLLVVAVTLVQAPQAARVMYSAAQDVIERDFVKAVALWGVPGRLVVWRQVMPSLITPLAVESGLRLSFSIILISGLNFLGFGAQPPAPSWGVMVNENRLGLGVNPWGVLAPAILLALLSVGTNVLADAIARANSGEERSAQAAEAEEEDLEAFSPPTADTAAITPEATS